MKATKNLLQAELCSTLQRRKNNNKNVPIQSQNNTEPNMQENSDEICSIIDYKNPNFITPKNSTITAIRKQTSELKAARANNLSDQNLVANIAELVSKLPDSENLMEEINRIQQQQATVNKDKQPVEKRMISHGKPNFIIKSVNPMIKSKFEQTITKNDQINGESKIVDKMNEKNPNAMIPPIPPVRTNESSQSVIDLQKKLKNLHSIDTPTITNPSPKLFRKYDTLPLHQPKTPPPSVSMGFKANHGFVQNKLKILQNNEAKQSASLSSPFKITLTPKCSPTPFRKFDGLEVQTTTNGNGGGGSVENLKQFKSSPISPRRAQLFKQQQNILSSQVTSPPIHHLDHSNVITENDKSSTTTPVNNVVVSFSKDLSNAPNRYPDHIKITKPIENAGTTISNGDKQQKFLSDIKFIIDSNGSVATVVQK